MENIVSTATTTAATSGNVPLSPILKTALATVNTATSNGNDDSGKSFPEDKVSKDYYFDSYAHL